MTQTHLELVLGQIRRQIAMADLLTRALAEWLNVYDLGPTVVETTGGLWTPRDVALCALREATGKPVARAFSDGLRWLRNRQFFRPHTPSVFEADPLAMLSVAIGIRHCGDMADKIWIADIANQASVDETDEWRRGMLSGAVFVVDAAAPLRAPAELAVALCTRGVGVVDDSTRGAAFQASMVVDDAPGERAAARLATLTRSTPFSSPVHTATSLHPSRHDKMKVLILAANPTTTGQLLLDEEVRAIEEKIRLSEHRNAIEVVSKWAVRPDDLHLALLQHKPTIVHFSGHGAGRTGIVFHGDIPGRDYLINGDALRHLFETLKRNIRVVVLNACTTSEQAETIANVVDFVVGMDASINDESARKFASSFYLGIASGESVGTAFQLGISGVKVHGLLDSHIPRLYVRSGVSAEESLC